MSMFSLVNESKITAQFFWQNLLVQFLAQNCLYIDFQKVIQLNDLNHMINSSVLS